MVDLHFNSELEIKQALLAAIVASSDDAIISKTLDGNINSSNPSAERLFGYSEKEAIGRHISLIIPRDRLPEEDYIIEEIVKGRKVEHFETIRETKYGTLIPLSLTISPIFDNNGKIIGASKIARDISEKRAIEYEREQLYRKAKFLNKRKDELVAMATHELMTPLTSLTGFLQILREQTSLDDPNLSLIDLCLRQTGKLTTLINDLLDISRLRDSKVQLQLANFDIGLLIKEIFANYQNLSSHQLILNITGEAIVYADRLRIEQVLTNLITNAIKYSPNGGVVEVTVREGKEETFVSVWDEGIGIDTAHLEEVFTQFYRVIDPRFQIPGMGLGLCISKEIIDRHGGTITVESQKDVGSTFKISFPKRLEQIL